MQTDRHHHVLRYPASIKQFSIQDSQRRLLWSEIRVLGPSINDRQSRHSVVSNTNQSITSTAIVTRNRHIASLLLSGKTRGCRHPYDVHHTDLIAFWPSSLQVPEVTTWRNGSQLYGNRATLRISKSLTHPSRLRLSYHPPAVPRHRGRKSGWTVPQRPNIARGTHQRHPVMMLSSDRINHDLHLDPTNAYHAQSQPEPKFTDRLMSGASPPAPSAGDSRHKRGQYRVSRCAGAFTNISPSFRRAGRATSRHRHIFRHWL